MSAAAICELVAIYAGAHAVLCRHKIAIQKGWQQLRPTPGEIWNHLNDNPGNTVGVVPFSLGYTVMDVDVGPVIRMAFLAPPAVVIPSRSPGRTATSGIPTIRPGLTQNGNGT